jgi:hypothetical protein
MVFRARCPGAAGAYDLWMGVVNGTRITKAQSPFEVLVAGILEKDRIK